ncbi:type III-B CRISPR-associated protein Cas10/Cmr2 [Porphyromonas sp.]|uniref:type III-B CRISPR-associated protein Cas10/Cmr2 n=1 Tax=Porphyromonas sp. TaxID=1924944 RepID=UPI0026DBF34A|nr:type III-B CRISPR-associated protein Cas10/Cmr2 [Porphyromonas sp.]MDO4770553.1 type III-B CRISPR-associated protein Cas10/Cmr2 [Porphyromonas sp.]
MSTNTYTAVTIGPIYKTIEKARSVKAFWTASYMFSWIMKRLLEEYPHRDLIISPCLPQDDDSFRGLKHKVGLFPDRLFIAGDAKADIEKIKEKVLIELAEEFKNTLVTKANRERKLVDFQDYLKNYISISTITLKGLDSGVLKTLNEYLDTQELFSKSSPQSKDYMEKFIEDHEIYFLKDFREEGESRAFESTSEIAVSGWLSKKEIEGILNNKSEIDYTKLTHKEGYRNCYKYLAIINADGDNFGKYIKKLSNREEMQDFAQLFFDFSVNVTKKLMDKTKAVPVYIGGDDLKLFTPILEGESEKDIFRLIDIIDECFREFWEKLQTSEKLSMSYGVSIFYHKSPMSEALKVADDMKEKAKSAKGKDAVAISIQKHSGQKIEFRLPCKHSTSVPADQEPTTLYAEACELIKAFKGDVPMINSLIYWIEEMYEVIFTDSVVKDERRIKAVFDNFFDESTHKEHHEEDRFFDRLQKFIYKMYNDKDAPQGLKEKKALLHGILRYCQFVTAKDEK